MIHRIVISLVISISLIGCLNNEPNEKLKNISSLVERSPSEALDSLNAISYASLSNDDKHFYDFLSVKISDKAYITHTSDSLILKVINYEANHRNTNRYVEALYYGGRVYSDLGDYPTALKYFQEALSFVDQKLNIHLRGNILSQIGRLLNKLRLYDEAIPYIKETIHIDSIENNSFNLAYDNQLIGSIYLHANKPYKAMSFFKKALTAATALSNEDKLHMKMYLSACELEINNLDSARLLIRGIPDSVSSNYRNVCLAYASNIYLKSGILDTAYLYSLELVHSMDVNSRKNGYSNILSSELIKFSNQDSIIKYIEDYRNVLETYYDQHETQQLLMQNSLYNYHVHERKRIKAEESRNRIIIGCCVSLSLILILIIVFLLYRIKVKRTIIKLQKTIARLDSIQKLTETNALYLSNNNHSCLSESQALREQLRKKIDQIDANEAISSKLVNSSSYAALQKYIDSKKIITDSNLLWSDLYAEILQCCPEFQTKLHLLLGGNIKSHELQTILLIKCGVTPTQMTYLLGKTKGSISSRRESLGIKILGEKFNLKTVDAIIRSL